MAKPLGIARATKNNDNKHPQQHDEWMLGKKIGRKKQVWITASVEELIQSSGETTGHWEKT